MLNLIYILEIIFSIIGIYLIFIQNPKNIQNSFVATSLETFKFERVKHDYKFWGTLLIILIVVILIIINVKIT